MATAPTAATPTLAGSGSPPLAEKPASRGARARPPVRAADVDVSRRRADPLDQKVGPVEVGKGRAGEPRRGARDGPADHPRGFGLPGPFS